MPVGSSASLSGPAPPWRHGLVSGSHLDPKSENDWKFRLRSCQSWKASGLSLGVVVPTSINWYRMSYVGLGRDSLRSHFVFRPRHAPEWLRPRFLPVFFLANEEELTGKTFTTSLNTTNPNTYVKFIFLRTSPLNSDSTYGFFSMAKKNVRSELALVEKFSPFFWTFVTSPKTAFHKANNLLIWVFPLVVLSVLFFRVFLKAKCSCYFFLSVSSCSLPSLLRLRLKITRRWMMTLKLPGVWSWWLQRGHLMLPQSRHPQFSMSSQTMIDCEEEEEKEEEECTVVRPIAAECRLAIKPVNTFYFACRSSF